MHRYLVNSVILYRPEHGTAVSQLFRVGRVIKEDTLTIHYEASLEPEGVRGELAEYYPKDDIVLERRADGRLDACVEFRDAYDRFVTERNAFIKTHRLLREIRGNEERNSRFIPEFEIYAGCAGRHAETGTAYLFFPDIRDDTMTIQAFCDELRRASMLPMRSLELQLKMILSLAKGVGTLHQAGLLCPGISLQRIGLLQQGRYRSPKAILLETGEICSVFGDRQQEGGPSGFTAPEILQTGASVRTDLYSIGCMLFYVLTGLVYRDDNYNYLEQIVSGLQQIASSEEENSSELVTCLTGILQKCLGRRNKYRNCEQLEEDLREALLYVTGVLDVRMR